MREEVEPYTHDGVYCTAGPAADAWLVQAWLFSLDTPNLFGNKRKKLQSVSREACTDGVLMRGLGRPSKIFRILAAGGRQGAQHGVYYWWWTHLRFYYFLGLSDSCCIVSLGLRWNENLGLRSHFGIFGDYCCMDLSTKYAGIIGSNS